MMEEIAWVRCLPGWFDASVLNSASGWQHRRAAPFHVSSWMNGRMVGARWPSFLPVERSAQLMLASPDPFGEDLRSGRIDKPEGTQETVEIKKRRKKIFYHPFKTVGRARTHRLVKSINKTSLQVKSIGRQASRRAALETLYLVEPSFLFIQQQQFIHRPTLKRVDISRTLSFSPAQCPVISIKRRMRGGWWSSFLAPSFFSSPVLFTNWWKRKITTIHPSHDLRAQFQFAK